MYKVVCFDLDDTLSKEIKYLESAYKEIARYAARHCEGCSDSVNILEAKSFKEMLRAYHEGKNTFDELNSFLGLSIHVKDYLDIYRNFKPTWQLLPEVSDLLNRLKEDGCILGLTSDGRSVQQRNKFNALGLNRWINNNDVVISEEFGSEKPSLANYEYFMKRYPNAEFTYVGDNPKKDFFAPNQLGWNTVCLLDNGENIHKQTFESVGVEYLPKMKVKALNELIELI